MGSAHRAIVVAAGASEGGTGGRSRGSDQQHDTATRGQCTPDGDRVVVTADDGVRIAQAVVARWRGARWCRGAGSRCARPVAMPHRVVPPRGVTLSVRFGAGGGCPTRQPRAFVGEPEVEVAADGDIEASGSARLAVGVDGSLRGLRAREHGGAGAAVVGSDSHRDLARLVDAQRDAVHRQSDEDRAGDPRQTDGEGAEGCHRWARRIGRVRAPCEGGREKTCLMPSGRRRVPARRRRGHVRSGAARRSPVRHWPRCAATRCGPCHRDGGA